MDLRPRSPLTSVPRIRSPPRDGGRNPGRDGGQVPICANLRPQSAPALHCRSAPTSVPDLEVRRGTEVGIREGTEVGASRAPPRLTNPSPRGSGRCAPARSPPRSPGTCRASCGCPGCRCGWSGRRRRAACCPAHDSVEEDPVVRNDENSLGCLSQKSFQPLDGSDVEMVRRFIQQQQFGL